MKKSLGFLLRLTVSLAALAGLAYVLRGRLGEALLIIRKGLQWQWFLLAIAAFFVALGFISWRLQLVFRVQGVKVSFPQTFYLSLLGLFFTLFFPSAMGGDVAKGYFAYQYSGKKLGSLTGVILDRLLGFVTIVLFAVAVFAGYSHTLGTPFIKRSLYGAVGLLVFGIVFFSNQRFAQKFRAFSFLIPRAEWRQNLSDLYHAIRNLQHHPRVLWGSLALSIAAQFIFFVDGFLLARSLGISISLWPFFILMPLIAFVSLAPSLSGLGVREAGFVFFFKPLMPAEKAFALSLVYDFLFYGSAFLAGLIFAFKGGLRKEVIHDLERAETLQEVGRD